jgi:hypothetical protein
MPGRVVDFLQVRLNGLGEVRESLVNGVTLAGDVNLQALRDVLVLFPMQRRCQDTGVSGMFPG